MANEHKKITMTDIASRAGVSQSTVSRVLNRHSGIDPRKTGRVLKTMKDLGYEMPKPASAARIGVLFCPLPEQKQLMEMDFHIKIMEGIESVAFRQSLGCFPYSLSFDADTFDRAKYGWDEIVGLILVGRPSPKLVADIEKDGIPYVILEGGFPPDYSGRSDMVCPDEYETARVACDYLERNRRKRVGFILSEIFRHRIDGYRLQLMRRPFAEIRDEDIFIVPTTSTADHIDAAYEFIRRKEHPDALVVSYYGAALALKQIFEHHGIRIPDDLLLLTYAHTKAQDQIPSLLHDARELGYKAGKRLLEKIADPADPPQKTLTGVELINVPSTKYTHRG